VTVAIFSKTAANESNKESVKKICIDDFAFKKGHRCGTIIKCQQTENGKADYV
jgi:hypothetical protein